MSGPQPGEIEQAQIYLRMLTAAAPPGSLLDVRYRTRDRGFARMFLHAKDANAVRRIATIGDTSAPSSTRSHSCDLTAPVDCLR